MSEKNSLITNYEITLDSALASTSLSIVSISVNVFFSNAESPLAGVVLAMVAESLAELKEKSSGLLNRNISRLASAVQNLKRFSKQKKYEEIQIKNHFQFFDIL